MRWRHDGSVCVVVALPLLTGPSFTVPIPCRDQAAPFQILSVLLIRAATPLLRILLYGMHTRSGYSPKHASRGAPLLAGKRDIVQSNTT